jgi:hypothetical protein
MGNNILASIGSTRNNKAALKHIETANTITSIGAVLHGLSGLQELKDSLLWILLSIAMARLKPSRGRVGTCNQDEENGVLNR